MYQPRNLLAGIRHGHDPGDYDEHVQRDSSFLFTHICVYTTHIYRHMYQQRNLLAGIRHGHDPSDYDEHVQRDGERHRCPKRAHIYRHTYTRTQHTYTGTYINRATYSLASGTATTPVIMTSMSSEMVSAIDAQSAHTYIGTHIDVHNTHIQAHV
jgi:hypothetical protein